MMDENDPHLRDTFEKMIRPIVEDKFLYLRMPVRINEGTSGYKRKPLRKQRDLTPFGFDFFNASIEAHPLSTVFDGGQATTRIRVLIIKGCNTYSMGIIEVNHAE